MHPLRQELARSHDYLSLMQLRMGPRLQFTLELPEPLAEQPVPSLLLQPLVENAIRHGLEPSVPGGSITVRASAAAGQLQIEVIDSGVGASNTREAAGYGLPHVRERLQTLWGSAASLRFSHPDGGGTHVCLRWPLTHAPRIQP
jgi:sensor histidine kinase YesM